MIFNYDNCFVIQIWFNCLLQLYKIPVLYFGLVFVSDLLSKKNKY